MNPLLAAWLADAPPSLSAVGADEAPLACAPGGLTGGPASDFRRHPQDGTLLCPVCALGPRAPWEPTRVQWAVIPELPQGMLNARVIRLTVHRADPIPLAVEARLPVHLLAGFQRRAILTRRALPWAASPILLRQTPRAMPMVQRTAVGAVLDGLRTLPEPTDPAWAAFFHRRRQAFSIPLPG